MLGRPPGASETKQIVCETRMKSLSSETAPTTHTVNVRFVFRQTQTEHRSLLPPLTHTCIVRVRTHESCGPCSHVNIAFVFLAIHASAVATHTHTRMSLDSTLNKMNASIFSVWTYARVPTAYLYIGVFCRHA